MKWLPVAVFMYTISNSLIQIVQMWIFGLPSVKKYFKIVEMNKSITPKKSPFLSVKPLDLSVIRQALNKTAKDNK